MVWKTSQQQQGQFQDMEGGMEGDGYEGYNPEEEEAPMPPAQAPSLALRRGSIAAPSRPSTAPGFTAVKSEDLGDIVPRPGETERQAKVRAMTERIRAEARKARQDSSFTDAQREMKRKQSDVVGMKKKEEEDGKKLELLMPQLESKVSQAEEEAEKVNILAAPLAMEASEELRALQSKAARDTERAVKAAMGTTALAKRELDKRQQEAQSMAPQAKEYAKEELAKFSERLDAAQAKLDEHKNVRKDHEAALAAEKLYSDLASRLGSVEIDCEKAAMMTEPLARALEINPEDIGAAEIRETKESLRVAQATLAPTLRLISGKAVGLRGPIKEKMDDLKARAEAAKALVDKAQRTVEESQSRVAVAPLLKEAQERAEQVEIILEQMRESEAPFLMGIETMPADEADEILQSMDKAAAAAHSALADALKYIGLKMVEVGRLAEGAAESARGQLEKIKQQIETGVDRVRDFQADATKRRRSNLVEVVKGKIEEAEAVVLKMKEAGGAVMRAEEQSLQEVLEKAIAYELEAQGAVAMARRELQAKQQDLRPLEGDNPDVLKSSSEIMRTKVRVQYMEGELAKFRKLAKTFEEKIKVNKSLTEILASLKTAEEQVEKLSASSLEWPADSKPPEEDAASILDIQGKLSTNIGQVEMKLQNAQGLELKELRDIFGRLQRAQGKLDRVKDLARSRSRAVATGVVRTAAEAVRLAEAKAASVHSASRVLQGLPIPKLEALNADVEEMSTLIKQAIAAVSEGHSACVDIQGKVEFARLQLRCKALERKGKTLVHAVGSTFGSQAEEAADAVKEALREALHEDATREEGGLVKDTEALFDSLAQGGAEVSEKQLSDLLARRAGIGKSQALSDEQVRLALRRIAPYGLTRRAFAAALADFLRVVRDITLTDDFQVSSASKVRKMEVGEIVEAMGVAQLDTELGLERVQCRAIRDGASGWATIRSTQGTTYLQRSHKPFVWCSQALALRGEPSSEGPLVRMLRPGEALELLEGPREEKVGSDLRVRGVTCDDDTITGWLQVRHKSGEVLARLATGMHKCIEAIAMTDVADFENCTMVRRIDAGEALELLGDEPAQPSEGGQRRRFRACRDGREGWITTKGSQGTQYVRAAQRHYVCVQAAPVHVGLSAESAVSKVLMPGEAFAAFEEPKEVAGGERLTLRRARAVVDAKEGWVASSSALGEVQEWKPRYKVLKAAPLTSALPCNEAAEVVEVVRLLAAGELVDAVDQPVEDTCSNQLRLRCVAVSDKAAGWATVQEAVSSGDSSSLMLRPATAEEDPEVTSVDLGEAAPSTPPGGASQARGVKRPFEVKQEMYDEPVAKGSKGYRPKGSGKGGPPWYKGKGKR